MTKGTLKDFNNLPLEIKIDILTDFCTYSKTHVEKYKDGTMKVTPDFCQMSDSYEKPELLFEFEKDDFTEEEIATAHFLKYGEKFDRRKHEAQIAEFYSY